MTVIINKFFKQLYTTMQALKLIEKYAVRHEMLSNVPNKPVGIIAVIPRQKRTGLAIEFARLNKFNKIAKGSWSTPYVQLLSYETGRMICKINLTLLSETGSFGTALAMLSGSTAAVNDMYRNLLDAGFNIERDYSLTKMGLTPLTFESENDFLTWYKTEIICN